MTEEQKKHREKVIKNITELLQRNAFTFEFVVRKKPKGMKVIYEVTEEQLKNMMANAAKKNIEIPFGFDSELGGFEYTIPEGFKAEIKDGKVIVKKAESEDEKIRKGLLSHLRELCEYKGTNPPIKMPEHYSVWIDWLERQGEQKSIITEDKDAEKAAEEYRDFRVSCGIKDPVMLNEIEMAYYKGAIRKWRPSEEQVNSLDRVLRHYGRGTKVYDCVRELLWQLTILVKFPMQ